jgi:hypothetical protein
MQSLDKVGDARSLAQIVVETVREPLFVLGEVFTILAANGSFHNSFKITPAQTFHQPFFTIYDGAWNKGAERFCCSCRRKLKTNCDFWNLNGSRGARSVEYRIV